MCMYIYMYICIYKNICTYAYMYMNMHIYIYIFMYTCIYTYIIDTDIPLVRRHDSREQSERVPDAHHHAVRQEELPRLVHQRGEACETGITYGVSGNSRASERASHSPCLAHVGKLFSIPQPSALMRDAAIMQRRGPKRRIAQAEKMPPMPSSIPTERLPTSAVSPRWSPSASRSMAKL